MKLQWNWYSVDIHHLEYIKTLQYPLVELLGDAFITSDSFPGEREGGASQSTSWHAVTRSPVYQVRTPWYVYKYLVWDCQLKNTGSQLINRVWQKLARVQLKSISAKLNIYHVTTPRCFLSMRTFFEPLSADVISLKIRDVGLFPTV